MATRTQIQQADHYGKGKEREETTGTGVDTSTRSQKSPETELPESSTCGVKEADGRHIRSLASWGELRDNISLPHLSPA